MILVLVIFWKKIGFSDFGYIYYYSHIRRDVALQRLYVGIYYYVIPITDFFYSQLPKSHANDPWWLYVICNTYRLPLILGQGGTPSIKFPPCLKITITNKH